MVGCANEQSESAIAFAALCYFTVLPTDWKIGRMILADQGVSGLGEIL
jgi:hypothetical protein